MSNNQKPQTLTEWDNFMNGYRDPKSVAEHKRRALEMAGDDDFYGEDFFRNAMGGGGGDSERECGFRKDGGTYAVCPTSPNGLPLESFLVCNPKPVDMREYNLKNVGVSLVDLTYDCSACGGKGRVRRETGTRFIDCPECKGTGKEIVTHIFDIVGADNYPNVADFLEETRRLGVSRRLELETAAQYARLSKKSRIMLLHHKAVINNPLPLYASMKQLELARLNRAGCPKGLSTHILKPADERLDKIIPGAELVNGRGCASLFWNVLQGGESIPEERPKPCGKCATTGKVFDMTCPDCGGSGRIESPEGRFVERKLASGTYRGYAAPDGAEIDYALGIFAVFPLAKIEVIDPEGIYEEKVARAAAAKVDVIATDC